MSSPKSPDEPISEIASSLLQEAELLRDIDEQTYEISSIDRRVSDIDEMLARYRDIGAKKDWIDDLVSEKQRALDKRRHIAGQIREMKCNLARMRAWRREQELYLSVMSGVCVVHP